MTFNQGAGGITIGVGRKDKGHLPQGINSFVHMQPEPVKSDLQRMLADEQAQHMDTYKYAHGHNDHGLGQ